MVLALQQLLGSTNRRRRKARRVANGFDSALQGRICDVGTIPREQIVNPVYRGNGNVQRVDCRLFRKGNLFEQGVHQVVSDFGHIQ